MEGEWEQGYGELTATLIDTVIYIGIAMAWKPIELQS